MAEIKYFSHANAKTFADEVKALIAAAKAEATYDDSELVGRLDVLEGEATQAGSVAEAKAAADAAQGDATAALTAIGDSDTEGSIVARLDVIEGEGDGSIKKAANDATASAIAQLISDSEDNPIDGKFDTLKEIADWILSTEEGAEGLDAATRLGNLETAVGVPASGEGESAVAASGLYKAVADEATRAAGAESALSGRLDALEGEDGSVAAAQADATAALEAIGDAESGLTKDVADLKAAIGNGSDIDTRLEALETTVGDAESGLVKDVADLKAVTHTEMTEAEVKALFADNDDEAAKA